MPTRRRVFVLSALAALAVAAPAAAAPLTVDTVDLLGGTSALTTDRAVTRSCFDAPLAAGTAGVVRKQVTAGIAGFVDARLHGAPTGADWDLAVFDAVSGKLVGASAAFGGNEVVRAPVATGELLTVQACRYGGDASPIDLTVDEAVVGGTIPKPEKQSLALIKVRSQADVDRLQASGLDLNETGTKKGIYAVLHGTRDAKKIRDLGLTYTTTVPDLRAADAAAAREDATATRAPRSGARAAGPTVLPSGRTSYRHLADYEMDLKKLVTDHPGVVRPLILGHKSVEGRTVAGIEIANGVERTDDGRPTVMELGLHHVREWSSGEVTIEYALDLFKSGDAAEGVRKQKILDGERTIVIPVVNPDGLVASQTAGDYVPADDAALDGAGPTLALAAVGAGSYRRKNCANNPSGNAPAGAPCALQDGVDLNRNYAAFWGGPGESDDPMDQTFRGPSPFSEPEAQNIHELSSKRQVTVINSNHNFAGDVLYQPGFNRKDEPGLPKGTAVPYQPQMKAVAKAAANAAGYVDLVSYDLYDVTGATEDWNYFAQGAFGYTVEVGYDNFHPNYTDAVIDQYLGTITGNLNTVNGRATSKGLRESLLLLGEAGLNPEYHSQITGTAPAGRLLRLTKDFTTTTSKVLTHPDASDETEGPALQVPEHLETTLTVPVSGSYTWAVDPSTRPLEILAGRTEAWTLTCEDGAGKVFETRKVTVAIGATSTQNFTCSAAATPPTETGTTPTTTTPPTETTTATTTPAITTSTPATSTPGSTTTPSATPGKPTAAVATRIVILRPAFSARRTMKFGGLRLYLRVTNGPLRNVRATIKDADGRTLLSGSAARLSTSGRVKLVRRAKLATGGVVVSVTGLDAQGRTVRATLDSRLVR